MSNQTFIVLLVHQNGSAVPLLSEDEYTMRTFDTHAEAHGAAKLTRFGDAYGYTILRWDGGVTEVL